MVATSSKLSRDYLRATFYSLSLLPTINGILLLVTGPLLYLLGYPAATYQLVGGMFGFVGLMQILWSWPHEGEVRRWMALERLESRLEKSLGSQAPESGC